MEKIKQAVLDGKTVYWMNDNYEVIHDKTLNKFLVHLFNDVSILKGNSNYVGLNSYYREYEFKIIQICIAIVVAQSQVI